MEFSVTTRGTPPVPSVDIPNTSGKIAPATPLGIQKEAFVFSPRQFIAIVLATLMAALPALSEPQAGGQRAGQITAMIPAATRNSQTAKPNEELMWGDLLQTEHSGRLRANLADGSIISLGSDTQLHVVQHDEATQQTSLELTYGKVRSQVQKITQPGGKYEIKTPNAVIGVIGTHFLAEYDVSTRTTTVSCYEGQVIVTPSSGAQVQNNAGQGSSNSVTLSPGQMVQVTDVVPLGGFHVSNVSPGQSKNGITSTDISSKEPKTSTGGNTGMWVAVGYAVAVGLALGLTVGLNNGSNKPGCNPNKVTTRGCP